MTNPSIKMALVAGLVLLGGAAAAAQAAGAPVYGVTAIDLAEYARRDRAAPGLGGALGWLIVGAAGLAAGLIWLVAVRRRRQGGASGILIG